MTTAHLTESVVEESALHWLEEVGFLILNGPEIAPGETGAERASYDDVVLPQRVRDAITRLNPNIPAGAQEEAFIKVIRQDSPSLIGNNHAFHQHLINGVDVECQRPDGSLGYERVRLIDFENPDRN